MRDRVVSAYALGIVTGAFITAAIGFLAPKAHADSDDGFQPDAASIGVAATFGLLICDTINNAPSAAGINRIGMALMAEGLSPRQTADAIVLAVDEFCPYHMPVLAAYAGQVSATA